MKLKNMFSIVAMLLVVFLAGCTKNENVPGVPPTVTLSDPLNNAIGVLINKQIVITFSKAMNPATITTLTYTLKEGSTSVAGEVTCTGTVATFTPTADLAYSKVYTVTITTGAKDLAGKAIALKYTSSFTTLNAPDTTLPLVNSTDPLNNATGVLLNKLIVITFSKAMDPATITTLTYTLKQGSTSVTGAVTNTGTTSTYTPAANLAYGKVYTVTVTSGVKDMAGNALAVNYTSSFTTLDAPDRTFPLVISTDPLNNATGVAANKVISLTFSEAMTASTINATTFTLKQGTTPVTGTVVYSGMTARFTPSANLLANTAYTATITTGAKDLAGNALEANTVWTFTTGLVSTVASADPVNLATGVILYKVVKATFSLQMDPLSFTSTTFTLKQGSATIAGTVSYSGTTASFTPTNNLLPGTSYTATITTGVKSVLGFALASDFIWNFTTNVPSGQSVVNLGSAANYVILAKTKISNIPTSAITGDLGLSPAATSYITGLSLTNATGYATAVQVTGKIYASDMAAPTGINLTTAVENMITAYNDAAGRPTPDFLELSTGNIGGKTLTPGLYKWTTTVTMPSDVTISGGANDVWIFQISQNLLMSSGVRINLIGGAQAKNIFWQVAGQATLGTTSHFEGILLSMTGITLQTGASFKGRALAQTAVVLDGNAVILP